MQYAKFRIHSPGDIVPFFPVNYGAEHESTLWLKYSVEAHDKKGLWELAGREGEGSKGWTSITVLSDPCRVDI